VTLVLALAVLLVGGMIVALTLDFVYRFFWISTGQRGVYVDHTTVLSAVQAKMAWIIEENRNADRIMHVPALGYDSGVVPWTKENGGQLTLKDLRFDEPWSESMDVQGGTGRQRANIEVFDMHFKAEWVNYNAFEDDPNDMKDFPPVFNMTGDVGSGGYDSLGDHKGPGAGSGVSSGADELDPEKYGAYLIRVRLYDHQGKLLRTAEEAFVQILPSGD
jgi:hypothetical protein